MDADFAGVETWVFDLDNTLYPARLGVFPQVERRINAFLRRFLDLDEARAREIQKRYYLDHGSTLRGLMDLHDLAPEAYLDFVHDVDLGVIDPDPVLDAALAALPGRKLVFTMGTVAYAERVLARLGVVRHFAAIFDIAAAAYHPKPDPRAYARLVEDHAVEPRRAVMFEDIARNLEPAHALGMRTVWIPGAGDLRGADPARPPAYVHHVVSEIAPFLARLSARLAAARAAPLE
ncbi:MAG: pyrimidine 5'-nucleotidase [Alphaproteobacteria bacterium]|nr:pyrimidine 5'-nucleotidase [Alphaproteobacteria bacterium]